MQQSKYSTENENHALKLYYDEVIEMENIA